MKKIKNLFIYLLVLTMLFGVKINAAESTDINQLKLGTKDHLSEKIYIKNWLTLNGLGTNELSNPSELLGLDGSIAAVCFDLNESGYIIINSNNLDIMEYSFTAKSPFKGEDKVYYNGPLQYYTERDGNVYDIKTKELVEIENISDSYLDVKISEVEQINKLMQINTLEPAATTSSIETDYLNYSLEPWASSYYCHPDGWSSGHAVVVHGYFIAYDGVPYVYVNDTFGHNNISINASSVYFPNKNMWFIN